MADDRSVNNMSYSRKCQTVCDSMLVTKFKESLDASSHSYHDLGGIGAVDRNGIDDHLQGVGTELIGFGDLTEVLVIHIGLHHGHAVGSQSASLV